MTAALEVTELRKNFGKVQALQGLTFSLPEGVCCAFVGANGAGKTTTFSLVGGFLRPASGKISIAGNQVASLQGAHGKVGILPQDMRFFEERTLSSQLLLFAKLVGFAGQEAESEVERVLSAVALSEKRNQPARALSRGMRVRLGIAQALIGSPPLILLDEPMAGLDPVVRSQIRELIGSLGEKTTVVISSHELGELQNFCDYICIIDKGQCVFVGPMKQVLQSDVKRVTYSLERLPDDLTELTNLLSSHEVSSVDKDNALIVEFAQSSLAEVNKIVLAWLLKEQIPILEVSFEDSLQEAYLRIIGQ